MALFDDFNRGHEPVPVPYLDPVAVAPVAAVVRDARFSLRCSRCRRLQKLTCR